MQKSAASGQTNRLTERELSRKLGTLQRAQSICWGLALASALAGLALVMTARRSCQVGGLLCFGVTVACVILGRCAQKNRKTLVQQQLGDFFQEELERFFGPEPNPPVRPLDAAYLQQAGLTEKAWQRCEISAFYEGVWNGLPFSAGNVVLLHEYETHHTQEGVTKQSKPVFQGVAIRCAVNQAPVASVTLRARNEGANGGSSGGEAALLARFALRASHRADGERLLTPEFCAVLRELEQAAKGSVEGVLWSGKELSLLLNTGYRFAELSPALDMRDVDGLRRWFTATLQGMERFLEILQKDRMLFEAPGG